MLCACCGSSANQLTELNKNPTAFAIFPSEAMTKLKSPTVFANPWDIGGVNALIPVFVVQINAFNPNMSYGFRH
jgi:hypothetical protein